MQKKIERSLLLALSFSTVLIASFTRDIQEQSTKDVAQKEWNFMTYMSNNNNLHRFGIKNFHQMTSVGSTDSANVLLQMDEYGAKEIIRFFIEKNKATMVESQSETATSYSGTPENLFDFARWGIQNYPAQNQCFVLWNHGAGIKDPHIWGRLMKWRDEFFIKNKDTGKLDLNRTGRTKSLTDHAEHEKGIAFNDEAEAYLTNDDLKNSLAKICNDLLGGNKIEVLAMDACHMAMVEIASQIKHAANIMVGSAEVEPGSGYDYVSVLNSFALPGADGQTIARQIVACYEDQYKNSIGDYTQSAVDLRFTDDLEAHISKVASLLTMILSQGTRQTTKAMRTIRNNKSLTTEFYDPDYIDLYHFFKSLAIKGDEYSADKNKWFSFFSSEKQELQAVWGQIKDAALDAMSLMNKMIIANVAGENLPEAHGLAIYFPQTNIHDSYPKTVFAQSTTWLEFLKTYLAVTRTKDLDHDDDHEHDDNKPCCDDCAKTGGHCADEKAVEKTVEMALETKTEIVKKVMTKKKGCTACGQKKVRKVKKS